MIRHEWEHSLDLQAKSNCKTYRELSEENLFGKDSWEIKLQQEVAMRTGFSRAHAEMDWRNKGKFHSQIETDLGRNCQSDHLGSVFMLGPTGTGKTAYLSCMLKTYFNSWAFNISYPAYVAVASFCQRVSYVTHKELIEAFHDYEGVAPRALTTMPILILDEFLSGHDDKGGFNLSHLEDLINARWAHRMPTWIASNLNLETLRSPRLAKIYSRLADKGWMQTFQVSGEDQRKQAKG